MSEIARHRSGNVRVDYRPTAERSHQATVIGPSAAIAQSDRRPAHLHGSRAIDRKGALIIAHGCPARHAQILHRASHALRKCLAVKHDAVALAIERAGHGLDLLVGAKTDIRRKPHDGPSLDGGRQLASRRDRHGFAGLGNAHVACLLSIGILVIDVRRSGVLPVRTHRGGKTLIGRQSDVGARPAHRRLGTFRASLLVRSGTRLARILGSIRLLRGLSLRLHSDLCHALGKCRSTRHRPDEQHRESSCSQALEHNVVSRHPFSFFREPAIEPWRRRRGRRCPGSTKAHVSHPIGSKTHAQQHPL